MQKPFIKNSENLRHHFKKAPKCTTANTSSLRFHWCSLLIQSLSNSKGSSKL